MKVKVEAIRPESLGITHYPGSLSRQQNDSTNYRIEAMKLYWLNHNIMTCSVQQAEGNLHLLVK